MDATSADRATTITRMDLRDGGWIGYDDEAIYLRRAEESDVRIPLDAVSGISLDTLAWDLAVMSLLLLGVGAFVGLTRNPLVGVGFAAVGLWSLLRTYRKRYELVVHVDNESTPVTVYPAHPAACRDRFVALLRPGEVGA